jgi:hypothetical protein
MYEFLQLQEGSNVIRIITKPYLYLCHPDFVPLNGSPNGQRLKCPSATTYTMCDLCKSSSAKRRWVLGIIAKANNNCCLLDCGTTLYSQIRELALSHYWGDPEAYDLEIRNSIDYYAGKIGTFVVPIPKTDLFRDEQLIKANFDLDILKQMTTPPTELVKYKPFGVSDFPPDRID